MMKYDYDNIDMVKARLIAEAGTVHDTSNAMQAYMDTNVKTVVSGFAMNVALPAVDSTKADMATLGSEADNFGNVIGKVNLHMKDADMAAARKFQL